MALPRIALPRIVRAAISALLTTTVLFASTLAPSPASAITRDDVLARARSWTSRNISYSQSRYHDGYRTDCSGFVSMAWEADASYTTRTIDAIANRIPYSELQPGDAILTPGHIVIFAGWANSEHTEFVSLEEANSRMDAVERVKSLPSNGRALRFTGITEPEPPAARANRELRGSSESTKTADQIAAEEATRVLARASLMVDAIDDPIESRIVGFTADVAI